MKVVNAATQPVLRTIGRVVGSDVLADAVAFFQAFAGMEGGFRERAEEVIALLRSDDDPLRARRLAAPRHRHGGRVVRRPDSPSTASAASPASPTACTRRSATARRPRRCARGRRRPTATSPRLWRNVADAARAGRGADDRELAPFAALLGDGPLSTVPLLAGDVHDLAGLDEIRRAPVRTARRERAVDSEPVRYRRVAA